MQELTLAVGIDQACPGQLLDVMRDRRLGDGELLPQPQAGAFPLPRDRLEQGHAPRVGQGLADQSELLSGQPRPLRWARSHGIMIVELVDPVKGARPGPARAGPRPPGPGPPVKKQQENNSKPW
jgi:hypothetical protein